jgi:hypothetical protein
MVSSMTWSGSDELLLEFVTDSKAFIFVRKTLQVLHCEIKKL